MIPLRATSVVYSPEWPSCIILHHTNEFTGEHPYFKFDDRKFQSGRFMDYSFKVKHKLETSYHFIIEKIGDDFHVITSQPLLTECVFEDLNPEYNTAIHVAFLGDYNRDLPEMRMYRVLAYRLLAPLMRLFYLNDDDIFLHSDISNNKDITCPGKLVEMDKIQNQLISIRRRKSIKRR